jgi:hypothetical protein
MNSSMMPTQSKILTGTGTYFFPSLFFRYSRQKLSPDVAFLIFLGQILEIILKLA